MDNIVPNITDCLVRYSYFPVLLTCQRLQTNFLIVFPATHSISCCHRGQKHLAAVYPVRRALNSPIPVLHKPKRSRLTISGRCMELVAHDDPGGRKSSFFSHTNSGVSHNISISQQKQLMRKKQCSNRKTHQNGV